MPNVSDLGYYVLYVIKDKTTGKMKHVGKYSSIKAQQRVRDEIDHESEIYEEIDKFDSLSEITSEIRYLKIDSNYKMTSYKKPRRTKIKQTLKDSSKNHFVEYKLVNGTYITVPISVTDYS